MEKWFKEMTDNEISIYLLGMSENAIAEMEKKNKNESIKIANEMNKKIKILVENICSFKGFYHGTPMYDFYEELVYDLKRLSVNTEEKMIEVYKRLF